MIKMLILEWLLPVMFFLLYFLVYLLVKMVIDIIATKQPYSSSYIFRTKSARRSSRRDYPNAVSPWKKLNGIMNIKSYVLLLIQFFIIAKEVVDPNR
jgi:hypothetical protein